MELTKFEKLMLINAKPIKFWFNLIGGLITLYLLWEHEIIKAILIGGVIIFLGTFLAAKYSKQNNEELAKTKIGNIFLQYSTKFGFACYLISHVLIPISFWYHDLVLTGVGLIVLIVGLIKKKQVLIIVTFVFAVCSYVYISDNYQTVNLPDNIIPINLDVTTVYLIKIPSGFLLFDTGYEQDFEDFVKTLNDYQINVNEIKYVLLSHHHDDHVGFVGNLTQINKEIKLIVYEETVPLLASGRNNKNNGGGIVNPLIYTLFKIKMFLKPDWTLTFPPFTVRDQDIIVNGTQSDLPDEVGIKGAIIHTPGHTTDGICLMLNEHYLLVGDQASNFLNWAGAKHLTLFNENVDEVYKSWEKMIAMNIKFIVPSHGKPFRIERLKENL